MMNCDTHIKKGITLSKDNIEAFQKQSQLLKYEMSSLKAKMSLLQSMLEEEDISKEEIEKETTDKNKTP